MTSARLFRAALALSLTLSALLFFVWSWRWPLLGDASLIHYIGFLIQRGWAPYRDLGDMNMPGSFLIEIAAMHLFGAGPLAWRFFDFTLLLAASAAFFSVAQSVDTPNPGGSNLGGPSFAALSQRVGSIERRLAGLFAASLFILIHGRDGLAEGGQRDLTMAVLLLTATAFLFLAFRGRRRRATLFVAAFGLLSGVAATIKPTSLPLTIAQLALAVFALRVNPKDRPPEPSAERGLEGPARSPLPLILTAALAYLIAPAIALVFLLREHALAAFLAGFHGIVPYYAGLGHRPLTFVVMHSISPLLPLVLLWLVLLALRPATVSWRTDWERNALVAGVLFGLINCMVQQRALPYYRYPLLVFLLPLMALDFTRVLVSAPFSPLPAATGRGIGWGQRALALLALAFGGFFLAPQSAVLIHRYQWWNLDFIASLEQNLNALGGPSLSRHIQCIDSISGCGNVLYRMRLEPATGVLSDFLLFGAVTDRQPPGQIPIIRHTRAEFLAAILAHPPQVIVVTSHLHMDGPDNFEKLARWPAFEAFLADRYTLRTEWRPTRTARWWSREETPASYRIYVLRSFPEPRTSNLTTHPHPTGVS